MIYLVSNSIVPDSDIESISVEDSITMIKGWPVVQFDTETTGLDPHVCSLQCIQFGYRDFKTDTYTQIVVDCTSVDIQQYKSCIESSSLVGHNLKFDLQFLYNHKITPLDVYDTMICEQTLYLGYSPKEVHVSLADVLKRYTGIELDKSFQKKISSSGLTEEAIRYAANDVKYLQDIRKEQLSIATSRKCKVAFMVENRCVPAMAYMEWCGIRLDVDKWQSKMQKDREHLIECEKRLDDYVVSHTELKKKFTTTTFTPSLFDVEGGESYQPKCTVQWSSPKQSVEVFKALGFNTKTFDKETKKVKESVQEKFISTQTGIDDTFLKIYFDYKGAFKSVTGYGQNFINQINPTTGRIHTVFRQIGTVTGRMASGSNQPNKDLARVKKMFPKDVTYCNLQNLPSRGAEGEFARSCFISNDGNNFLSCDYSSEESRVQADVWNEQFLLDAFEKGTDTHNIYAKLCFPEELKDVNVDDVKKQFPELRQKAKSAEFAVAYGSDGTSIAASIGMPVDAARTMVKNMTDRMPGMKTYKSTAGRFLKNNGYLVINETTGHRVNWSNWGSWKAVEDSHDYQFWQDYQMNHAGTGDSIEKSVKKHLKKKHEWLGKNVLNYPIQGGSAVVLKRAAGDFFRWIVKNNLFGTVLICAMIHDEMCCECPQEYTELVNNRLPQIMQNAAAQYYHKLPIPADCAVGDHWIH